MCFIHPIIIVFLIVCTILLELSETGIPLQLIPFRESRHALRLVPNTLELNEIIDRTVDSIRRFVEVENNSYLPIEAAYRHFNYKTSNNTVLGVVQTGRGVLRGFADFTRSGNAYIYNNEEDSIQVVAKFLFSQIKMEYEQCNVTLEKVKDSGGVVGVVDKSEGEARITLRARQNYSLPLIFVCDGKVDEVSLTLGDVQFSLFGTQVLQEFQCVIKDTLTCHLHNTVPLI